MGSNRLAIASGVIIENVGDDLLVFTPSSTEAVRLTGAFADTVVAIQAGKSVDTSSQTVSDLVGLGIIEAAGLSRRGLITAGALGAGAGIALLSMPAAAASSSPSAPSSSSSLLEIADSYFQPIVDDNGVREGWYFYMEFAEGNVPTGEVTNLLFSFNDQPFSIEPADASVLDDIRNTFELRWDRNDPNPDFGSSGSPLLASFTLDGLAYTDVPFRVNID